MQGSRDSAAIYGLVLALCGVGMILSASAAPPKSGQQQPALPDRETVGEMAKNAKTVGDYTELVDTLTPPVSGSELLPKDDYFREMLGWALNRRGEVYLKHATLAQEEGNAAESQRLDRLAIADFELAVRADPAKWKALHNRGTFYAVHGRLQEALRDFDRVVSLNPDYANAWFNRAELRFDLGQYEPAIRDYSEALLRDDTLHSALQKRGLSKFKLGKVRSALADFENGLEADDSNAELYVDRGECHRALGNWERAAADFRRAIELQPDLSRAYQRVAWLMATCPEPRFRDAEMAIRAARQTLELGDADDYQSRDVLAAALANDGQYELAVEELQRAIGAAPRDARPLLDQRLELYQSNRPYRQRVEAVAGKKK